VPIAATAKSHFDTDIARARALLIFATAQAAGSVRDDTMRLAWMFSVGTCDAYFCDLYVDLLARTMRAKNLERAVVLPKQIEAIEVPLGTAMSNRVNNIGWEWRMFARERMERDNVLSIRRMRELLNPFARTTQKFLSAATIERWILHPHAKRRLLGTSAVDYRSSANQKNLRQDAIKEIEKRFRIIFQRRHDCIHNCDRPKVAIQAIASPKTTKVLDDVEFFVNRSHEDVTGEFRRWISSLGFNAQTKNTVLL
jgi:hypothetical protein